MSSKNGSKRRKGSRGKGPLLKLVLFGLAVGAVATMLKRLSGRQPDGPTPYEGEDIVEHSSMTSFPASDAPAY